VTVRHEGLAPAIGVDLGGTRCRAAVVCPTGEVLSRTERPTPASDGREAVLAAVVQTAREACVAAGIPPYDLAGIGIASGGQIDARTGRVLGATSLLPGWGGTLLAERVGAELAMYCRADNDGNAGALGEWLFGAGKGCDDLIYLCLGTGIGGGVVSGGRLMRGHRGIAGELGHIVIDPAGPTCSCGAPGCLEVYASGSGLARRAEVASPGGFVSGGGAAVVRAARAGDPLAAQLLREAGEALGFALGGLVNVIDPSRIIVGGSLGLGAPELLLVAQKVMGERALSCPFCSSGLPPLVPATLRDDVGVIGAAALVWEVTDGAT